MASRAGVLLLLFTSLIHYNECANWHTFGKPFVLLPSLTDIVTFTSPTFLQSVSLQMGSCQMQCMVFMDDLKFFFCLQLYFYYTLFQLIHVKGSNNCYTVRKIKHRVWQNLWYTPMTLGLDLRKWNFGSTSFSLIYVS